LMIGGTGDDIYFVDSNADLVVEGASAGNDWVFSSISGYTIGQNVENLVLIGNAIDGYGNSLANSLVGNILNNTLAGLGGNDSLDGGDGIDTLQGGLGNDVYIVDTDTDTIEDIGGTDTVFSSVDFDLSNPLVNGGTGIENLVYTGSADAALTGNALSNSITGGVGNDTLLGTSGAGASEIDTLTGGAGADLFVLADGSSLFYNTAPGSGDYALITDFNLSAGDRLQLKNGIDYIFSDSNFSGSAIGGANSYLYRDADGSGSATAGDNLIAAIVATGGAGTSGNLITTDIGRISTFV
jgi:Ca2+-binding RTX toxin-like protein